MINFFRKIRQKLLSANKVSQYLTYAIGEIVLVVIGILIALQINTWNQNRIEEIERKKIIASLHSEFIQNKEQVNRIINRYDNSKKASLQLMGYMGMQKQKNFEKKVVDSLFDAIFPAIDYLPSNNAVDNIIQSGKLKTLKNLDLSIKLSDWKSLLYTLASREEKLDDWIHIEMLPYLNDYISWRDVGVAANYNWSSENSTLPTNYRFIFSDLEFENILENHIYFINACRMRYYETSLIIDEIIRLTEDNKEEDELI